MKSASSGRTPVILVAAFVLFTTLACSQADVVALHEQKPDLSLSQLVLEVAADAAATSVATPAPSPTPAPTLTPAPTSTPTPPPTPVPQLPDTGADWVFPDGYDAMLR